MDRSTRTILRKLVIDFLCLLIVGMVVLYFFLFGKPFKRGFFCNDESLYHPYANSTVTSAMLYITGLFLPICVMIIGEYVHSKKSPGQSAMVFFGYTIPPWIVKAYSKIGVFGFGAISTTLITDIAKYNIGRLRPHFMTACVPNVDCSLPENQHRYIEDFTCTATNVSARLLKEIRLSFPSGHSSFSAYTMVYLAMYLQLRFTWRGSRLLKHFLQLICLSMAWFTAMSRVSNYKHHWSDVLAGSSLGIIIALIVAFCIADLFKKKRGPSVDVDKSKACEYEGQTEMDAEGTQTESRPLRSVTPTYGGTITLTRGA
ncbi:putative phosphatidate phosphatase [Cephus cinctus]|uniref:Phosphatidate phosphatase n=1 Tax=Cephus cinctus TaxID=211228 RepID=A0AAJ7RB41_CEPCN|nr:putative phosphatidate phosphatase [Cephus cinctus]